MRYIVDRFVLMCIKIHSYMPMISMPKLGYYFRISNLFNKMYKLINILSIDLQNVGYLTYINIFIIVQNRPGQYIGLI